MGIQRTAAVAPRRRRHQEREQRERRTERDCLVRTRQRQQHPVERHVEEDRATTRIVPILFVMLVITSWNGTTAQAIESPGASPGRSSTTVTRTR